MTVLGSGVDLSPASDTEVESADPSVVFVLTEEGPCIVLKAVDCGEADGHLLPGNGADITVIAFTGGIIVAGREQF